MKPEDFNETLKNFLKAEGLILVSEDIAKLGADIYLDQKRILKQKTITPYLIAKFRLLPGVKTLKTIKNMVEDGRISKNEYYIDNSGKMHILTMAVKRLRNEV